MSILCKLFGHKIIKSTVSDTIDDYGEIGRLNYCDRCSYSEFNGSGSYDSIALSNKIREDLLNLREGVILGCDKDDIDKIIQKLSILQKNLK